MGFFSNTDVQPADALPLLSQQRIMDALERMEWKASVDEDGDLIGGWENGWHCFRLLGENGNTLMVRGGWYGRFPVERQAEVEAWVLDWNRRTLWPKALCETDNEGNIRLGSEHAVDYRHGLTDDQLESHIACGVLTAERLFEEAAEAFPDCKPAE